MHKRLQQCKKDGGNLVLKVHTTHAKTTEMANDDPPAPSCNPIAVARAITVAECDDGIPPDPSILLESHLLSLNLQF